MSRFRAFAGQTDFHGFSHMVGATKIVKVFWMTIVIVCAGGFMYQSTKAVMRFMEANVATSYTVKQKQSLQLPDMAICIPAMFDRDRMRRENLTENFATYASSGFFREAYSHKLGLDVFKERISLIGKLGTFEAEFNKTTQNGREYENIIKKMLFSCKDVVTDFCYNAGGMRTSDCCVNASRSYRKQSLCWTLPGPNQTSGGQGNGLVVRLQLPTSRYFLGITPMLFRGASMQFSIREYPEGDEILLPEGSRVAVAVEASHGKYLSTDDNPCEQDPPPYLACVADCIAEDQLKACQCQGIDMQSARRRGAVNITVCTPKRLFMCKIEASVNLEDEIAKSRDKCRASCKFPCEMRQYRKTVSTTRLDSAQAQARGTEGFDSNMILLDVYYSSLQLLEITQYRAMTEEDLVGMLGGLMGLWLGGSVVAATHLICFWLGTCANGRNRDEE